MLKTLEYISVNLEPFKFVMRVVGAYGIIQVFAQDIGIPTGCEQARLLHNEIIQIIIFTCSAYAVTDDFTQSFLGTMTYFFMKYIFSKKTTNNVCFPDKKQIDDCGI
jgi:hypothetical protein